MPEAAAGDDAAEVEVVDGVGVHARRERQRGLHEAVLEARHELRLPAQPLHLPRAEGQRRQRDERQHEEAGAVAPAAGAHELGRVVEDRGEGRVVGGLASRAVVVVGGGGAPRGVAEGAAVRSA